MLKTIIIIDCYRRRFRDRYRYKENAYIGDRYDTDPIIGGILTFTPVQYASFPVMAITEVGRKL